MPTVSDILCIKGPRVLTIGSGASVLHAALQMNDHNVGSLVVMEDDRVEGIVTERDILRRIVAMGRDPLRTPVDLIMTREVVCCNLSTPIEDARAVMMTRRIRHLPVINDERHLQGLISIGDLNAYHAGKQEVTIQFLHEYLYGQV